MSVDQLVSSDLAVLAHENRRAVPTVDAVLRNAGIGAEAAEPSTVVVLPTSVALVAMARAFSRRVGRATIGVGLFAVGVVTVVAIATLPYQADGTSIPQLLVDDFVLGRRGFVLALLLTPMYLVASRIAASVFAVTIEAARTDAAAKEAGARLLRRVDGWTFALGLVGIPAAMMIGGFLWYVGFHPYPNLGLFVYPQLPPAWRAIELYAVFGGGVSATIALAVLMRRESRSPRASRILALLAHPRVALGAMAVCVATVAVIKLAPDSARWTEDHVQNFTVTQLSVREFNRCSPECLGADMNLELIPGSYGSDRLRIALTFVGGVALFVLVAGLALRRRRREHEL